MKVVITHLLRPVPSTCIITSQQPHRLVFTSPWCGLNVECHVFECLVPSWWQPWLEEVAHWEQTVEGYSLVLFLVLFSVSWLIVM